MKPVVGEDGGLRIFGRERVVENASLVGLSRQVALRRELDVISNNVANMNTSGFKSDQLTFGEHIMPKARDDNFARPDRPLSFVEDLSTWHDQSPGVVQTTGGANDLAIDGDGLFVVQTAAGERYTRNGAFQINAAGELVTTEGARVMSTAGLIQFAPTESGFTVASDGTITTSEGIRGRLRVARFANMQELQKDGGSLFKSDVAPNEAPSVRSRVLQGVIEKSNVKPITEMSRLIEVTRAYESVTSMLSKQDELRRSSIERLAEVPA